MNLEDYLTKVSQSLRTHLDISSKNLPIIISVLLFIFVIVYLLINFAKKIRTKKYYENLFNKLCDIYQLSVEEKIKLNTLARMLDLKHPILLFIQPKRWDRFLSEPEVSYLYKKLF